MFVTFGLSKAKDQSGGACAAAVRQSMNPSLSSKNGVFQIDMP
jgi:hypothetical protein